MAMESSDHTAAQLVCYRHPDRPTRISCSECGRPVCVECMLDASVGHKCPECAAHVGRARVVTAREVKTSSTSWRTFPVTAFFIAASVIIYVLGEVSPSLGLEIFQEGALFGPAVENGEWWRLLTAAFLHGSLLHVLFNMWALWIFGPPLERQVGSGAFAMLLLASALAGSAAHLLTNPGVPAVGASGAVFGLFGAWLVASFFNRHTVSGRANLQTLTLLLVINGILGFTVANVAWEAHLGGLIAGALIAVVWNRAAASQQTTRVLLATPVMVVALALGLLV